MLTIKQKAETINLIDLGAARKAEGVTDQTDDEALKAFITRASDAIARYCGRTFALETVEETFRLDRLSEELMLSRYPVAEIVGIAEGENTLVTTDYELDPAKGIITRLSDDRPCWWPPRKVVVTYRAGFDLPRATPPALQQACVRLVQQFAASTDRDPLLRSEAVSDVSDSAYFADAFAPEIVGLLAPFKTYRVT